MAKLTFLGTGTSCGVPTLGCFCDVCTSTDPHDKRLRTSALLETENTRILIDCGPDFRQQMLQQEFRKIDAILITHSHYDHVGGIDDLRPYCRFGDIDIYADEISCASLRKTMPYCFVEKKYPVTLHGLASFPICCRNYFIHVTVSIRMEVIVTGLRVGVVTKSGCETCFCHFSAQ